MTTGKPVQPEDQFRVALRDLVTRIRRLETRHAPTSLPNGVRIGRVIVTTTLDADTGVTNVEVVDAITGAPATLNGA